MNETHKELRNIWNVGFDPDEVRWCVSAEMNGKVEWFESVSEAEAQFVAAGIARAGFEPEVQQLSRGEIRRQFGEPDFVMYTERATNEPRFMTVEHGNDLAVFFK